MIPPSATEYGFVLKLVDAYTGRTIMYPELSLLLNFFPPDAGYAVFRDAIVEAGTVERCHDLYFTLAQKRAARDSGAV